MAQGMVHGYGKKGVFFSYNSMFSHEKGGKMKVNLHGKGVPGRTSGRACVPTNQSSDDARPLIDVMKI